MTISARRARGGAALAILASLALARPPRATEAGDAAPVPAPGTSSSALGLLEPNLTPAQRADSHWLESLGWQFVRDPGVTKVTLVGGTPCQRPDLASAQRAGDLRIRVPVAPTPLDAQAFAAQLPNICDWVPTRCAYQFLMAGCVRRAVDRLSDLADRDVLRFPRLLFIQSPTYKIECPAPEWRKEGRLCIAQGSASRALEAVYARGALMECFTGQIFEMFSAQYELYGSAWFDQVFKPEEIAIGGSYDARNGVLGALIQEEPAHPVRSLFIEGDDQKLDPGLALAKFGPMAWVGVPGVLMNLVQNAGANQNLIYVSVTPEANQALLEHGGLAYCDELLYEALGDRRDARRPGGTTGGGDRWEHANELLKNPALTGIMTYVHPHGVMSLAELAKRELAQVGGKLHVRVYSHAFEWFMFHRYRAAWTERWLKEHGLPVPSPAPAPGAPAPATGGAAPTGTGSPPPAGPSSR